MKLLVDFVVKSAPAYNAASIKRVGPWRDDMWQKDIRQLEKWARKRKLRIGKYFLYELDGLRSNRPDNKRRWETCLEIKGKAKSQGKVKVKKVTKETVVSVRFNPDKVSARLVYHGLSDWLRWRLEDKTFKRVGATREVYSGNPWRKPWAWARAEVQVLVKKK